MGVLTQDELAQRKLAAESDLDTPNHDERESAPVAPGADSLPRQVVKVYLLFHPENPREGYLNTEFDIVIDSNIIKVRVENGQVRTADVALKDKLVGLGYQLIQTKEQSR